MLLGTFQPKKKFTGRKPHIEPWGIYLGHRPIFCFPARNVFEFAFGCWTSTPSEPEQVIIFDADYYVPYDAVRWNQLLGAYIDHPDDLKQEEFGTIFKNVRAPYGEFVVKEINNIVHRCDVNKAIYGSGLRGYDRASRDLVKALTTTAKQNISEFKDDFPMPFVKKEAFSLCLAPAFWSDATGEEIDLACMAMTAPMAPEPREFDEMQLYRRRALGGETWASHSDFDKALSCLNKVWRRHYEIVWRHYYGGKGSWNPRFTDKYPFE